MGSRWSIHASYHLSTGVVAKGKESHLPAPTSYFPGAEFRYQDIKAFKPSEIDISLIHLQFEILGDFHYNSLTRK